MPTHDNSDDANPGGGPCSLLCGLMQSLPKPTSELVARSMITASFTGDERFDWHPPTGLRVNIPDNLVFVAFPRASTSDLRSQLFPFPKLRGYRHKSVTQPPKPQERSVAWWYAQLTHYGLPITATRDQAKESIKLAISCGRLEVPPRLQKLEAILKKQVIAKNGGVAVPDSSRVAFQPAHVAGINTTQMPKNIGLQVNVPPVRKESQVATTSNNSSKKLTLESSDDDDEVEHGDDGNSNSYSNNQQADIRVKEDRRNFSAPRLAPTTCQTQSNNDESEHQSLNEPKKKVQARQKPQKEFTFTPKCNAKRRNQSAGNALTMTNDEEEAEELMFSSHKTHLGTKEMTRPRGNDVAAEQQENGMEGTRHDSDVDTGSVIFHGPVEYIKSRFNKDTGKMTSNNHISDSAALDQGNAIANRHPKIDKQSREPSDRKAVDKGVVPKASGLIISEAPVAADDHKSKKLKTAKSADKKQKAEVSPKVDRRGVIPGKDRPLKTEKIKEVTKKKTKSHNKSRHHIIEISSDSDRGKENDTSHRAKIVNRKCGEKNTGHRSKSVPASNIPHKIDAANILAGQKARSTNLSLSEKRPIATKLPRMTRLPSDASSPKETSSEGTDNDTSCDNTPSDNNDKDLTSDPFPKLPTAELSFFNTRIPAVKSSQKHAVLDSQGSSKRQSSNTGHLISDQTSMSRAVSNNKRGYVKDYTDCGITEMHGALRTDGSDVTAQACSGSANASVHVRSKSQVQTPASKIRSNAGDSDFTLPSLADLLISRDTPYARKSNGSKVAIAKEKERLAAIERSFDPNSVPSMREQLRNAPAWQKVGVRHDSPILGTVDQTVTSKENPQKITSVSTREQQSVQPQHGTHVRQSNKRARSSMTEIENADKGSRASKKQSSASSVATFPNSTVVSPGRGKFNIKAGLQPLQAQHNNTKDIAAVSESQINTQTADLGNTNTGKIGTKNGKNYRHGYRYFSNDRRNFTPNWSSYQNARTWT